MLAHIMTPLALVLASLFVVVSGAPTVQQPEAAPRRWAGKRDVVSPPITSPAAGTTWTVGAQATVTWETAGLPPFENITNGVGHIYLGYINSTSLDEHLDIDDPLAQGFNITLGSISFTVPDVPPRDDYIIVLMGDSGNASPQFTISGGDAATSSTTTSSPSPAPGTTTASSSPPASSSPATFTTTLTTSSTSTAPVPSTTSSSSSTQTGVTLSSGSSTHSAPAAPTQTASGAARQAGAAGAWAAGALALALVAVQAL